MTDEQETKTLEERLAEAEAHLEAMESEEDDAQAALDEAKEQVEYAQSRVDALREAFDAPRLAEEAIESAAILVSQSGPQRPIGDRLVRTSCALSEIPTKYGERMRDGQLKGILCAAGCPWVTNGHWMIRVDQIDGLAQVADIVENVAGTEGRPVVREDVPRHIEKEPVRAFGKIGMALEYATLIEDLFPGVEWYCRDEEYAPFHALVNGETVAVVMPIAGRAS